MRPHNSRRALLVALMILALANQPVYSDDQSFGEAMAQANAALEAKNFTQAETQFRNALRQADPANLAQVREANSGIAMSLYFLDQLSLSEPYFRKVVELYDKDPNKDEKRLLIYIFNLSNVYQRTGKAADGAILTERRIEMMKRLNYSTSEIAQAYNYASMLWSAHGDQSKALQCGLTAYEMFEKVPDENWMAMMLQNNASYAFSLGRFAEAEKMLKRSIELRSRPGYGEDHVDVALPLVALAEQYIALDRLDEAEPLLKRALDIRVRQMEPNHPYIAQVLSPLADLYTKKGDTRQAQMLLEEAVERLTGNNQYGALYQKQLAQLYFNEGKYSDAERVFKKAFASEQHTFGKGGRQGNNRLRQQAVASYRRFLQSSLDRHDSAVKDAYSSATISALEKLRNAADASDSVKQSEVLYSLVKAYCRAGDLRQANQALGALVKLPAEGAAAPGVADNLKAAAMIIVSHSSESPVVPALGRLVQIQMASTGDDWRVDAARLMTGMTFESVQAPGANWIGPAILHLLAASKSIQATKNSDLTPFFADALSVGALSLSADGQRGKASDAADEAVRLYQIDLARPTSIRIEGILQMALMRRLQGDYPTAVQYVDAALALNNDMQSKDGARCFLELSKIALAQQEHDRAVTMANKAIELLKAASAEKTIEMARSLDVLCQSYENKASFTSDVERTNNLNKALSLCKESIALKRSLLNANDPEIVSLLIQDGDLSTEIGDYKEASTVLNEATEVARQFTDPDGRLLLGDAFTSLAQLSLSQKNWADGKRHFLQALEIHSRDQTQEGIVSTCTDLNSLAILEARENDIASARARVMQAAGTIDKYVRYVYPQLSFAEQRAFLNDVTSQSHALISIVQRDPKSAADTYTFLSHWRGLLVESLRRISILGVLEDDPRYREKYGADLAKLRQLRRTLAGIAGASDSAGYWQKTVSELNSEKEKLERDLTSKLAKEGVDLTDPIAALSAGDIANLLQSDEAFIDLYSFSPISSEGFATPRYAAMLLTRNASPQLIDLGPIETVNKAIMSWRSFGMVTTARTTFPVARKAGSIAIAEKSKQEWATIINQLWAPIRAALPKSTKRLIICDDAELSRLPWSLLPEDDTEFGALLTARVDSPREFVALRSAQVKKDSSTVTSGAPSADRYDMLVVGGVTYRDPKLYLKGSKDEADEIYNYAKSKKMKVVPLEAMEPTPEKIVAELPKVSIAHLATHGFFAGKETSHDQVLYPGKLRTLNRTAATGTSYLVATRNPLVESGLLLAADPPTTVSSKPDISNIDRGGRLTAEELVGVNLRNCDLVVLSACESGRGAEESGQGVLGLRSALIAAGAKSVLISLWKVDDEATKELMQEFYKQLWEGGGRLSKAEALREAQKHVRNKKEEWQKPAYWAAWYLVGEGWTASRTP